jgi:O-antigen ligase
MNTGRLSQIREYLLILFPYFLIFSMLLSNVVAALFAIATIAKWLLNKSNGFDVKRVCFAGSLFLVSAVGIVYSANPKIGLSLLETRIPLLLFPVVFNIEPIKQEVKRRFLRHYLASIAVSFVVTIAIAIYRNIQGPIPDIWFNQWYYHYSDLTSPIKIDPLYLALFVSFAVIILLLDQFQPIDSRLVKNKILVIGLLMLFGLFLVMIGVRSILIILFFLFGIIIAQNRKQIEKKFLIVSFALMAVIIGLSVLSPVTRERFEGLYKSKFEFSKFTVDRFIIWSIAGEYVQENPSEFIIGKGTGSSEKLMDELYKKKNIHWDFEKKTNTHNQYIGFLLDTGFIGLFVLVSFIILSIIAFSKSGDRLGLIFIVLMAAAMISENYLNRQKGVMFFSVFYSLFYFAKRDETQIN